jgi:uncharacterized protein (DUF2147 family)
MKKRTLLSAFIVSMMIATMASASFAASTDEILGVWDNQEKDARIEIFKCGEKFCGKIVSLKEPNYPPGSKEGMPGTPKLDHKNPKPELRKVPVIGLEIMHNFIFAGDDTWKGGKVYDPKSGNTYSGKMTLVSPTQLKLRGFIGISLFGRTDVWTR